MTVAVSPEIGKSIVAAGIHTNYLEAGQGAPVVMIHGSGPGVTAYANWRLVMPRLAERFRVLAPDMAVGSTIFQKRKRFSNLFGPSIYRFQQLPSLLYFPCPILPYQMGL